MRTISEPLNTKLDSLAQTPGADVTIERWLPKWTEAANNSKDPDAHYASGHSACVSNSALFRCRAGSVYFPNTKRLFVAIITGSDLLLPNLWETHWINTGIDNLARPSKGMMDCIDDPDNSQFLVFAITDENELKIYKIPYTYDGGELPPPTTIATLSGMAYGGQLSVISPTEVYILTNEVVEGDITDRNWVNYSTYGSYVHRYHYSDSTWVDDDSFYYHTHSTGTHAIDNIETQSGANTTEQWGFLPHGGLAVFPQGSSDRIVAYAQTFWFRYGYNTHNQNVMSFIHRPASGLWSRNFEIGNVDFEDDYRLDYDCHARGSTIGSKRILVWTRLLEPSDYQQTSNSIVLPRNSETVYAIIDSTGKNISNWNYLGDPRYYNGAKILKVNNMLVAIGWGAVSISPLASLIDDDNTEVYSISKYVGQMQASQTNRGNGQIKLKIDQPDAFYGYVQETIDRDIVTGEARETTNANIRSTLVDSPAQRAMSEATFNELLVTIKYGYVQEPNRGIDTGEVRETTNANIRSTLAGDTVSVFKGYIDSKNSSINLTSRAAATLACKSELPLSTNAEVYSEILCQETLYIAPSEIPQSVTRTNGYWDIGLGVWDEHFFDDAYGMKDKEVYRLLSFPYAYTGGENEKDDPGEILNARPTHKGTWWKDVSWFSLAPSVDGMIQTSVRFGDINNKSNFEFTTNNGKDVTATVNRSNGLITKIDWRYDDNWGTTPWDSPQQESVMGGVICHAIDIGKKYAFVWEANSDFSAGSHVDDTWTNEDFDSIEVGDQEDEIGTNKLHLIVSDYNVDNENWENMDEFLHVMLDSCDATGLIRGKPADLRMQILGGTAYCYYRATPEAGSDPGLWTLAFDYDLGFGAGRFGLIGRGHAGIQWDVLFDNGYEHIIKCDNYVDFWNIYISDTVYDYSLEEVLRKKYWQGFTETSFIPHYQAASLSGDTEYFPYLAAENLVIDFDVTIPDEAEAGIFVRGVDNANPTEECIELGLGINGAAKYAYKRYGDEVDYAPIPFAAYIAADTPVPVRFTVRGGIYTIWIADTYVGHFRDMTGLGVWWGLNTTSTSTVFENIYVPELYEIPEAIADDIGKSVSSNIKSLLGNRRIKSFYDYRGILNIGYFTSRASAGMTLSDAIVESRNSSKNNIVNFLRVEGAYAHADYASPTLLKRRRNFKTVQVDHVWQREFCYKEAQAIVQETAEEQNVYVVKCPIDPRIEPEDVIEVIIERQDNIGNMVVSDIDYTFSLGKEAMSNITLRSVFEL